MMFSSKTPRDLNRDPFPGVYADGVRCKMNGGNGPRRNERPTHDPRPEFDAKQHNEPNPILLDYRMDIAHTTWRDRNPLDWMAEAANPGTWPGVVFPFSAEQMSHARRVLSRLAALTAGEAN